MERGFEASHMNVEWNRPPVNEKLQKQKNCCRKDTLDTRQPLPRHLAQAQHDAGPRTPLLTPVPLALGTGSPLRFVRHDGDGEVWKDSHPSRRLPALDAATVFMH
ncbi:hypothetical protein PsAD14_00623 [Pseudovibrio sp. Ad14]|nr:hypothetical protein PsW74_01297 [Pseudovibrio sp. W74]KZL12450.1 hypothetical protein PsAD14_00623 [Pseudovibrio sp. Ad14]